LLLGREHELIQIRERMAQVRAGCGAITLLEGQAGIGKTALLAEAAAHATRSGFSVLRAAGSQLEQEYAFGIVRQLFSPVLAPGRDHWDLLEGAAALAAVPLGLVAGDRAEGSGDVSAAMHGLYWLTANLADGRPLLIVVDDAHWADAMSLRFVLYLAQRLADLPVLVFVAARPAAEQGDERMLARLGALAEVVCLRPAPLTEPEVGMLIVQRGLRDANERFVAACFQASGGNPFLLGQLLVDLLVEGARGSADDAARVADYASQGIVRWVRVRLGALGEDAERLAFAFAVLGANAPLADAALLAGIERTDAADAADALIGAQILAAERRYEFVHPLVRSAVYDGSGPASRAEAHALAARLAAERGAPLPRVAGHLLASEPGLDGWVVGVLRAAARAANASGAPRSAASYLERALAEKEAAAVRSELLFELGEAQAQAGLASATERIREALALSADPRRRAEICLALGRVLFSAGSHAAARDAFERGLSERPSEDDDLSLELRGWYVALAAGRSPAIEAGRLRALLSDDAPGRTRTERFLLALFAYGAGRSGERPHDAVAKLAHRALADGTLLHDSGSDTGPHSAACYALLYAGELDAAVAELDRAIEVSQRRGSPVAFGWFSRARGNVRFLAGDLPEALADLNSASDTYSEGYEQGLPGTVAFLALCLLERDDLAGATSALVLPGDQQRWRAQPSFISYLHAVGHLAAARGQLREGLDALLECGRLAEALHYPNPAASPWRSDAALLAARLGERDRAVQLVAEDLKLARAFGAPQALGIALRAAGLIEGGNRGLEQLTQAVAVLERSPFKLELARTLAERGRALRRAGRRSDAREALLRGLDLAHHCGARRIAAAARAELIAAGAKPRRDAVTGRDALTAGELRVARRAAEGLTNREIAQSLFITTNTAKAHLNRVYRKLDVTHRGQLADALTSVVDAGREDPTLAINPIDTS
jgi:DNA-binding CsgD family transcriptional regulator